MTDSGGDIRWGTARRFEFIEWQAFWAGRVNRKHLEVEFHISTPQASVDFRNYQEAAPGNIEYRVTERAYFPTQNFRPKFLKLSPERFLLQMHALKTGAIRIEDTWFESVPQGDVMPTIMRGPEAYTLRPLLRAIEMRGAVSINYQSLTRAGTRTICPHAFGHDGNRWHVRAWSVEREEFRDFALGRILSISQPEPSSVDPAADIEWHTPFTLRLMAHPGLDPGQKATVEYDYRLANGELAIEMRLALAFYFVRRYNLDLRKGEIPPVRAQLYLKNFEEYEAATAEAKRRSKEHTTAKQAG